jgi:signal transduction histidine kinase
MMLVALVGWSLAAVFAAVALTLRHRLELVARADHELRGPLAALGLLEETVRRDPAGAELATMIAAQLERARAGLADLQAARFGARAAAGHDRLSLEGQVRAAAAGWAPLVDGTGRSMRLDWRAGEVHVAADRGRLAQVLGNLISNAVEHGNGQIEVRGRRVGRAVRVEVANAGAGARKRTRRGSPDRARRPIPLRPLWPERGRGLTIATQAAREAGGFLELSSGGDGTTAAIELPATEPPPKGE